MKIMTRPRSHVCDLSSEPLKGMTFARPGVKVRDLCLRKILEQCLWREKACGQEGHTEWAGPGNHSALNVETGDLFAKM